MVFSSKKVKPGDFIETEGDVTPRYVRPVTLLDRLKTQRNDKEDEFAKLNQELIELDTQIAGLERAKVFFPQIEGLIEKLTTL